MAYDGWIEFNGTELINISRTTQLAEALGIDTVWTTPESVAWIQEALAGVDYDVISEAPWYDPGYPASVEFAGLMPLGLPGLDDSTLESTPIEYTTNGGSSGKPRNSTLPIVASVAIIASTSRGAEYGKRWMDRVLRDSGPGQFCSGANLRYFRYQKDENSLTEYGPNLALNPDGATGDDSGWAPPLVLNAFGAPSVPAGSPKPTALEAAVGVPAVKSFRSVPVLPGPPGTRVRIVWWGLATGDESNNLTVDAFLWEDEDASSGSGVGGTYTINPSDGWTQFTWEVETTEENPYVGVSANFNGYVAPSSAWVTGLKIEAELTGPPQAHRRDVRLTRGAVITRKRVADCSATWLSSFTLTCGDPFEYSDIEPSIVELGGEVTGPGLLEDGTETLTQIDCPVYDYTPVYDPLYPALVAPPTVPDFYPAGWDIVAGDTFDRYWARVQPPEPEQLHVVPFITLTTDVDARMVRVGIWASDDEVTDQCEPLFSAVVSYLPAGVSFYIDGEQQASYIDDGLTVRRTDSLVYSPDAKPVQWTAFNDPTSLLVTLDIFSDSDGGEGDGTVRLALDLIRKSD